MGNDIKAIVLCFTECSFSENQCNLILMGDKLIIKSEIFMVEDHSEKLLSDEQK